MLNTAPQHEIDRDTPQPIEHEAGLLDVKLKKYIRHRLKSLGLRRIDGETPNDIANATWVRALPQTSFIDGCTGVRISYLKTTANRYILNLVRTESQRPKALQKNWDKVLVNHTAVRAEDVWDHIAMLLGDADSGERQLAAHGLRRFNPDKASRDFVHTIWRVLWVAWRDIGGGDIPRRCHRCRYYWHRRPWYFWRRHHDCCHPVCEGMRRFATDAPSLGVAAALQESVGFVLSQVSMNVATCKGDKNDRDYRCSDCCCCCCNC